jgi:Uncharacterized protein conserved in bacteria (DUF2334)
MRFAIRDDDTCYFTRPRDLERVYQRLSGWPVSLAVTPFALKSDHLGDPARFRQSGEPMPMEENPELVSYLAEAIGQRRYSILAHGFTHEYLRQGPALIQECLWKDPARLGMEAAQSREYLERLLGSQIETYVPPGNSISRAGIAAVGQTFPNILATLPLRRAQEFLFRASDAGAWCQRLADQIRFGGPSLAGYRLGKVRLLACTSWTAVADWRLTCARLELARRLNADFTVAVHYWELKGRVLDGLLQLADQALAMGFEPAHCADLFAPTANASAPVIRPLQVRKEETTWADSKTS